MGKHRQTKACEIPRAVKARVYERDGQCCIITGKRVPLECACAHFIARSQGGLGVEQNIVTLAPEVHSMYDNGTQRPVLRKRIRAYLKSKYPDWDETKLVYRKYA